MSFERLPGVFHLKMMSVSSFTSPSGLDIVSPLDALKTEIPWQAYCTANLITESELDLIKRYDKQPAEIQDSLLKKDGAAHVEAFMSVLRSTSKEQVKNKPSFPTSTIPRNSLSPILRQNSSLMQPALLENLLAATSVLEYTLDRHSRANSEVFRFYPSLVIKGKAIILDVHVLRTVLLLSLGISRVSLG